MRAAITTGAVEKRITRSDGRIEEIWPLPAERDFLFALLSELFDEHWDKITWGPMIPGAAYELKCVARPSKITLSELGYFTAHWGERGGHFHLCIGAGPKMDPEQAKVRNTTTVELVRRLDAEDMPISWSLRMKNGAGDPQLTIYLPNPHLGPDDWANAVPEWDRLALWEDLFPRLTGHAIDGRDRLGKGYRKAK